MFPRITWYILFIFVRRGRWSNGDPVTAKDFAYGWQRILSPAMGSEYAYFLYCLKNARPFNEGAITDFNEVGVRVLDTYTLEATLEHPTPYFLTMQNHYACFPVHQATIEKFGNMDERGTKMDAPGQPCRQRAFPVDRLASQRTT